MQQLAQILKIQERFSESVDLFKKVLKLKEHSFGLESENLVVTLKHLAQGHMMMENHEEALAHYDRAIAIAKKTEEKARDR